MPLKGSYPVTRLGPRMKMELEPLVSGNGGQHTNTAVQKEMEFHSLSTGSQNKAGQNARSELAQQQQTSRE